MTAGRRFEVLSEERAALAALFEKHKVPDPDGGSRATYDMDAAVLAEVRGRKERVEALHDEWVQAKAAEELAAENSRELEGMRTPVRLPGVISRAPEGGPAGGERKSIGRLFVESQTFRGYAAGKGPASMVDVDVRTLFQTAAGWDPEDLRTGRLVLDEQQPPNIVSAIVPTTRTRMSTVLYMEETTYTNNAAEVAEGGTFGEAALRLTEQSSEVRKLAVFIPVTDEQFEDEQRAEDYVNNRLRNMLRQRLDSQLLVGNGTAPNLRGVLNVSGINTQAKGTDPTPDAIYKAMVKCMVNGFAMPSHCVLHPNDWQDIRLLRTADGIYIWGSPSEAGRPRIWGLPVIQTTYETENTGLVGDFTNYSELALRRGIEFEVSNSHSTYFVEGKQAIRASFRAAFLVYRALAFSSVTGI